LGLHCSVHKHTDWEGDYHEGNTEEENNGYVVFNKNRVMLREGGVPLPTALLYSRLLDRYLKTT
jgi:hypothetical protein